MKKLLFCLGTRPEAIKLAPLIVEAKNNNFQVNVLNTGQHKDLVKPVLDLFNIESDFWLESISSNLNEFTGNTILKLDRILATSQPDLVIVQGDTSSTFSSALAAYNRKIPIVHIEAGLRTGDIYSPYPEEGYRKMISNISSYHFCPTENDLKNLNNEDIYENCFVVGNTVIDSLRQFKQAVDVSNTQENILITVHRRENQGSNLNLICENIIEISKHTNVLVRVVCHPNPEIRKVIIDKLSSIENIEILNSVPYDEFIKLMLNSCLIITDSGGIQEEAGYLNIPTLVIRDYTERHFQQENLVTIKDYQIFKKTLDFFSGDLNLSTDFKQTENATVEIIKILNNQF